MLVARRGIEHAEKTRPPEGGEGQGEFGESGAASQPSSGFNGRAGSSVGEGGVQPLGLTRRASHRTKREALRPRDARTRSAARDFDTKAMVDEARDLHVKATGRDEVQMLQKVANKRQGELWRSRELWRTTPKGGGHGRRCVFFPSPFLGGGN